LAKPLSVKITSNFSFSKLAKNVDKILNDSRLSIAEGLANKTKKNITDGKLRALSDKTIEARSKAKSSFPGHKPSTPGGNKPLHYTGRLLNSIKATEKGVEGEGYALEHHRGFDTPKHNIGYGSNKNVPARPFLATEFDKKEGKVIKSKIIDKMNKAMKK
tara:strand:- start:2851 stop:3330 length:480 start_codon:yes stop_codon:yes gene_type:complete